MEKEANNEAVGAQNAVPVSMEQEKINVAASPEEAEIISQVPERPGNEKDLTEEISALSDINAADEGKNEGAGADGEKAEEIKTEEKSEIQTELQEEPRQDLNVQGETKEDEAPQNVGQIQEEIKEPEPKPEPKWYIVQTLTGQEDRVKERIEGSIDELGLREKIFRVLVPEEETVEIKGDKRIERKRKMYPGYVFIEMALDEDTWYKIRSTAGVARFIGGKIKPQAVTDREMQRVLKQLGIKEKEIKVEFENGEPIRIISGSFRGYTGSVADVIPAKSKLKAMINIFGRDTSVEVDFDRVEKIV